LTALLPDLINAARPMEDHAPTQAKPAPTPTSWWQTLPGILTATAGVLSALTALVAALHQTGWLGEPAKAESPSGDKVVSAASGANPAGQATASGVARGTQVLAPGAQATQATQAIQAAAGVYALNLPAARQLTADHMVYRIVSAQVLSEAPGKRQLQVRVQASNQDRYDANLWAASFRLQVQGALQAPSSELNELLPSHSSQQARLSFDIADDAQSADLQMGQVGEGAPGITLDLRRPSP
jgi:hypothetical protein